MRREDALALLEDYEPSPALLELHRSFCACVQELREAKKRHPSLALGTYEFMGRAPVEENELGELATLPLHIFFLHRESARLAARHAAVLKAEPQLARRLEGLKTQAQQVLEPLPKRYLELFSRLLELHAAQRHMYTAPPSAAEAIYRLQFLRPELQLIEELHTAGPLLIDELRGTQWESSLSSLPSGPIALEGIQRELDELQEALELCYLLSNASGH